MSTYFPLFYQELNSGYLNGAIKDILLKKSTEFSVVSAANEPSLFLQCYLISLTFSQKFCQITSEVFLFSDPFKFLVPSMIISYYFRIAVSYFKKVKASLDFCCTISVKLNILFSAIDLSFGLSLRANISLTIAFSRIQIDSRGNLISQNQLLYIYSYLLQLCQYFLHFHYFKIGRPIFIYPLIFINQISIINQYLLFHQLRMLRNVHAEVCAMLCLLAVGTCFLMEISPASSPKCYSATLFQHEDLLLEVQIPIIDDVMQIQMTVKNSEKNVVFSKIMHKNQDRITVNMDNSPPQGSIQVVQFCIGFKVADSSKKQSLNNNNYLIWLVQLNHFSHEIPTDKKNGVIDPFQIKFSRMKQKLVRLQETYHQQWSIFRTQEQQQSENQLKLESALNEASNVIFLETAAIVGMAFAYIAILKQYI